MRGMQVTLTVTEIGNLYNDGVLWRIVDKFRNVMLIAERIFACMQRGLLLLTADAFTNLCHAGSSIFTIAPFLMAAQSADEELSSRHTRIPKVSALAFADDIPLLGLEPLSYSVAAIIKRLEPHVSFFIEAILLGSVCGQRISPLYMFAVSNCRVSSSVGRTVF